MLLNNNLLKPIVLFSTFALLAACSSTKKDKLEFETPGVKSVSDRLVIPPDITGINAEDKYRLPGGSIRASEYNQKNKTSSAVLPKVSGVHIERAGNQRWLVVDNKTPTELWPTLYAFWQNMGFVINKEEKAIGFMETQWAENRANIPGDPIRDFLTNVGLGSIYSSSVRDKFIIRVEPNNKEGSIVSFTNQKKEEVFIGRHKNTTKWVSRPSDTNLEAQFLARYMLSLGYDKNAVAKELNKSQSNLLASVNKHSLILRGGDHNRNKYRLKLALDRIGLTVLNHSGTSNILVVSPALDQTLSEEKSSFLGKIFGKNKRTKVNSPREQIYIAITPMPKQNQDIVNVYDANHNMHPRGDEILARLYLELR